MARLDYTPYPEQTPTGDFGGGESINTPEAAYTGVAKGLETLGAQTTKSALAFLSLQSETQAKEADIRFSTDVNKALSDPQGGYMTKLGKDAATSYGDVDKQLTDLYQQHRQGLSPEAARMFDQVAVRRLQYAQEQASNHAATENKKWVLQTGEARIQNEVDSSALNWGDDKAFGVSLATIGEEAKDRADLLGEGPEQTAVDVRHYQSEAIMARVRSAMRADPNLAQGMLNTYADKLDAPHLAQLTAELQPIVRNSQARADADGILASVNSRFGSGGGGAIPEPKAQDFIRQNFPGATITSGARTPGQNAAVGGAPGSFHIRGEALDFVPPKGMTLEQARDELQTKLTQAGLPIAELKIEHKGDPHSTGDHIHWAWGSGAPQSQADPTGKAFQSQADYYRENYTSILADADRLAQEQHPGDQVYADQVRARLEQRLNDTIRQQELSYKADSDLVFQAASGAFSKGRPPASAEDMASLNPKVADAWQRMQADNPIAAQLLETRLLTANSKGMAAGYGTQFYRLLQSAIAPPADARYMGNINKYLPYVQTGEYGTLTNSGFNKISDILKMRGTPQGEAFVEQMRNFLDSAHTQISGSDPRAGTLDHHGDQQFSKFLAPTLSAIEAGLKAGKTPAQMFNPKSPDYVGEGIYNFTRPVAQRVKDMTDDAMAMSMYGPKQLAPAQLAVVDQAVQAKTLTPEKGEQLKGLMQAVTDHRMTRKQAIEQAIKDGLVSAPPPEVPKPGNP